MNLQTGDYIIIRGYNKDNFFSDKHFRKLLNKPTRVWDFGNRGVYIAHPDLDLIPLSDDVVYDKIIDSEDLPGHREYKKKSDEFSKLTRNADLPNEKPFLKYLKKKKKNIKEEEEKKESKLDKSILKIISGIQEGDVDVSFINKTFGSMENFISIVSKRNLLSQIDPFDSVYSDIQNELFNAFVKSNSSFIWEIVDRLLSDVTKIGDDYYYDTNSKELSEYFYDGRNDVSQDTIASILDFEFDYWGDDLTDDEYRDVYDELTPENKNKVKDKLKQELKNSGEIEFDYKYPELFGEISSEQGTEEKFTVDDNIIERLLQDEDSIRYLINLQFDDVRSELYSLYSMCYSDTLTDDWHGEIMDELVGFVIDDSAGEEYTYKGQGWDKDGKRITKTMYAKRYKATNAIFNNVKLWIESNYKYNDTIEYFGTYVGLMNDMLNDGELDYLRVRLDDYPDHRKVRQCLNDNIDSYI